MSARHPGDDVLIATLVGGATQHEAATAAGVSERTVRRRLQDPEFNQRLREAGDQMIAAMAARTLSLGKKALGVLDDALDDDNPHVRLRAAALTFRTGNELNEQHLLSHTMRSLREQLLPEEPEDYWPPTSEPDNPGQTRPT